MVIATTARDGLLRRTLDSLSQCARPADFAGVVVVENGVAGDARDICQSVTTSLPIDYLHSEQPGKNRALNLALSQIADPTLTILCDDDIRFAGSFLDAYSTAAKNHPEGSFFGGPFGVDYEIHPPAWLKGYLPLSARGWQPNEHDIRPRRTWFLGFNWAAFAGDLRRIGGFDEAVGPGSPSNSTGDEVLMQKRMHAAGMLAKLVTGAMVWHHVPASRCTPQWALDRAYRDGQARAQYVREKGGMRKLASDFNYRIKTLGAEAKLRTGLGVGDPSKLFQAQHSVRKAAGYRAAIRPAA
ncbi:MAG: glycosyltransferase [Planctomycetota bacterium]